MAEPRERDLLRRVRAAAVGRHARALRDGGAGLGGSLSQPSGVSVKSNGDLFVTSSGSGANIRRLYGPDP